MYERKVARAFCSSRDGSLINPDCGQVESGAKVDGSLIRFGDYTSKCPRLGEGSLVFILMIAWTMAERLRSFVRMRPVAPCARSHER